MTHTKALFILLLSAFFFAGTAFGRDNSLSPELAAALHGAQRATLYSLEPWADPRAGGPLLHRYKILGSTELGARETAGAADEFAKVVGQWNGITAACFDPRHALRVVVEKHTYDFLLCYSCQQMYVYRDDDEQPIAMFAASGTPQVLNGLLTVAHVPLSTSDSDEERAETAKKDREARQRWAAAVPKALRSFGLDGSSGSSRQAPTVAELAAALQADTPDARTRIRALLTWFGSGKGPWSGYPSYETFAEKLLLGYTTGDIVGAVADGENDKVLLEGAARLLADLHRRRPNEPDEIPQTLKQALLHHTLDTPIEPERANEDRLGRARHAFSTQ